MLRVFFQIIFLLLLALYIYLGVISIPRDVLANNKDLLAHAIGYFILIITGFLAYSPRIAWQFLIIGLLLFSLLIECIQYFLPWRSFSWLDMLANGSGLLLGLIACRLAKKLWLNRLLGREDSYL